MKVFLGGTVNGSRWRDYLMPRLDVDYFDPVVKEWTEEARKKELRERKKCDYLLYVLTPKMTGYYSIAEVTDDSYRRPDRTIFCYLDNDDGEKFTVQQKKDLKFLSRKVIENGAIYLSNLEDVAKYLNSANQRVKSIRLESDQMFDAFISYGRRHSSAFVEKMFEKLEQQGKKIWLDKNNIPLAVDFQEQIDDGIEHSDNFIFVISPHSIKSEYCKKEIELAVKYGKRIIPVLHIEPTDSWKFIPEEIAQLNWIFCRQKEDFSLPLKEWKDIDNFEAGFKGLNSVLENHKEFVRFHTLLLHHAINWNRNFRSSQQLLTGQDRIDAENWLKTTSFKDAVNGKTVQRPCFTTALQADYIIESKKNANNLQTEAFISFSPQVSYRQKAIIEELHLHDITTWRHEVDIPKGSDFNRISQKGIINADNYLFFVTKSCIQNPTVENELRIAKRYNKRIIPILLENISPEEKKKLPWYIRNLNFILFSDILFRYRGQKIEISTLEEQQALTKAYEGKNQKNPLETKMDELIAVIQQDADYYEKYKYLLVQAIKWKEQNKNQSILLRGYNLENALKWLKEAELKEHKPVQEQIQFIRESQVKVGMLSTEVFISYSQKDSDFSRRINEFLQMSGKTTWFDQESIASASDFQKEIYSGIESADNFLFIISPNAVKSPYCEDEINFALKKNKRIISVLFIETEVKEIPKTLRKIQWIDFTKRTFTNSFAELLRTLDIDREYIRNHTKYTQRANEWLIKKKADDLLLRGNELIIAQNWLLSATEKINKSEKFLQPLPSDLQKDYIEASLKEAERLKEEKKEHRRRLSQLQAEKIREADSRIAYQKKAVKKQGVMLIVLSLILLIALAAVYIAYQKSQFAHEKIQETQELNRTLKMQTNLLNLSKVKLELALSSIDSLQRLLSYAINNANSVEEAKSIVKEYNTKVNVKKKESESIMLYTNDADILQKGGTDIMERISQYKLVAQKQSIAVLKDSIEELNLQLGGYLIPKRREMKLAQMIGMYDVLSAKEKKLKHKLNESKTYDKLILDKNKLLDKISLTQDVIKIREQLLSQRPNNDKIRQQLATNYGNLSWYYMLSNKAYEAELSAKRGLELNPSISWINVYYAYALLLEGYTSKALPIFQKYKNIKHFKGYSFKEMYVRQINTLKKFEISSPDYGKVLKIAKN